MADVIQCPTCSKRYKLPERPPATFTCSACNTVMDLSAFREAAAAAAPAAAPAPSTSGSRAGGSGAPRSKSARPGAAAARARHARAAREGGDEEEGGGRGLRPPKKNNNVLIGSLIGFVVVIGIAIVVIGNKNRAKDSDVAAAKKKEADKKAAEAAAAAAALAKAAATAVPEKDPALAAAEAAAAAKKASAKGGLHPVEFAADTSEADRKKIDDLIQKAVFENNGSDSLAAGRELVAMGVKAAPRLLNVFYTVKVGEGFDSKEGKMKASVADSLLRKIDGYMERKRRVKEQIKATSDPKWAESTAKTWQAWWDTEAYKKPEKPYDARYDDNPDVPAMEDKGGVVSDPAMSGDGAKPDAPHDGK